MKKIIILFFVVVFLFTLSITCCRNISAQVTIPKIAITGVHVTGYAESGFENRNIIFGGNGFYNMGNNYFSTINTGVAWKGFNLYAEIKNYYLHENLFRYVPKQVEYKVGLLWQFKSFDFNLCHFVSHGIDNDMFYDSYNRVSIKYNIK
jgi:hypothetical protein